MNSIEKISPLLFTGLMPREPRHGKVERWRDAVFARHKIAVRFLFPVIIAVSLLFASRTTSAEKLLPSLDEVLASKQDLWGLAAMREPNGPGYEFFAKLLPPLRYVNAAFHHYPFVLGAPNGSVKARLVSNGSAINALAKLNTWSEVGTPVLFFVGEEQTPFGEKLDALEGPHYERGYLPIVQINYRSGDATYREETFASVAWTNNAVLFTRFQLSHGKTGIVSARIVTNAAVHSLAGTIRDDQNRILISFDKSWRWNATQKTLTAQLSPRNKPTLAVATLPLDSTNQLLSASYYEVEKKKCVAKWEEILARATRVETPEPIVNAAWKSTILNSFLLLKNDRMNYSAGNAYEVMYEAESGDNVRALLMWKLRDDARKMIPPLLDYGINPGLKFHDAAFKLQLLAHYFWLTRDGQFVREQKSRWRRDVDILTRERDAATGLLPKENYCGDEFDKVFSLNSNANGWRGLRDIAAVLQQLGENSEAERIAETANQLRAATLAAVEKSVGRDTQPPFIPIALFGEEKPYDVLTATRRGSYWNLMIPYVIGSGTFGHGSERETWMLRYLEEHGGLCMGMIRFDQHSGLFANTEGVDDLYGLRYVDALLRRDETDRALVSFYGKLAQGMTRDTFLNAEGTGLRAINPFGETNSTSPKISTAKNLGRRGTLPSEQLEFGRPMYLPPTCSGNALFLWTLRSLLVQDYDLNDDGKPETVRLLFATPRRWLEDGKEIKIENALTAFGEVSVHVKSRLKKGEVVAEIQTPLHNLPEKILLRIRLPHGWKIISAKNGAQNLSVDEKGTVDISKLQGKFSVRFQVRE